MNFFIFRSFRLLILNRQTRFSCDLKQSTTTTMPDQQEVFKMRKTCKSQFTRAEKNLQQALARDDVETATIERRFGELQGKFDTLQNAHDVYAELVEEDVNGELDKYIDDITDRFNAIEIEADKKIAARKKKETAVIQTNTSVSNLSHMPQSVIKAKRVDLDQFDGDIRKYTRFKENFTKLIAPRYGSDNTQLAFALKTYLVPNVSEEVESCGDDYPRCGSSTPSWRRSPDCNKSR